MYKLREFTLTGELGTRSLGWKVSEMGGSCGHSEVHSLGWGAPPGLKCFTPPPTSEPRSIQDLTPPAAVPVVLGALATLRGGGGSMWGRLGVSRI